MIIGGRTGSFLGEYQAGGIIAVLGLGAGGSRIVGNFPCTGMHGGRVFLRGRCEDVVFPGNVCVREASEDDLAVLMPSLTDYCSLFGFDRDELLCSPFTIVTPDSKNPYKQMYVAN